MSTKTTNNTNTKLTVGQQAELFNIRKGIPLDTVKIADVKNNVDYVTVTLSNGKYVEYTTYRVKKLFASDFGEKVTDDSGKIVKRGNSNLFNGCLHCVYNDTDSKTAVFRAEYDVVAYTDENGNYAKDGLPTGEYVTGMVNIDHDADEKLNRDNSTMVISDLLIAKKSDFGKYQTALKKAEMSFYKSIKQDSKKGNNSKDSTKKDSMKSEGAQG